MDNLQGLILCAHGSTVGAGTTLLAATRQVTTHVVKTSLSLLDLAVTLASEVTGAKTSEQEILPTLVGRVWDACEELKKAPPD